jgi:hypothetical protein
LGITNSPRKRFSGLETGLRDQGFSRIVRSRGEIVAGGKYVSEESEAPSHSHDFVFATGSLHYTRDQLP